MMNGYGRALVLMTALAGASVHADADSSRSSGSGDMIATSGAPSSITDTSVHTRRSAFVALLEFPFSVGLGVALRYEIPILPDGFIPSVNDSFELEPGLNLDYQFPVGYFGYGYSGYVAVTPHVTATWTFHFSERFAAYGLFGLGYHIGFAGSYYGSFPGYIYSPSWFYVDAGVGIKLNLTPALAFRAEAANSLRAGFEFKF